MEKSKYVSKFRNINVVTFAFFVGDALRFDDKRLINAFAHLDETSCARRFHLRFDEKRLWLMVMIMMMIKVAYVFF